MRKEQMLQKNRYFQTLSQKLAEVKVFMELLCMPQPHSRLSQQKKFVKVKVENE